MPLPLFHDHSANSLTYPCLQAHRKSGSARTLGRRAISSRLLTVDRRRDDVVSSQPSPNHSAHQDERSRFGDADGTVTGRTISADFVRRCAGAGSIAIAIHMIARKHSDCAENVNVRFSESARKNASGLPTPSL